MTVNGDELPCSAGSGCCLFATTENGSIGYGVPGEKMTVNHGANIVTDMVGYPPNG
jgi:hypothetical protein